MKKVTIYITREDLERQLKAECNDPAKFHDVKLEVILRDETTIEVVPSGRLNWCTDCQKEHGYDCPKDTPPEKDELFDQAASWMTHRRRVL